MANEFVQVNVNLADEDAAMVDHMMRTDGYDNRSAWMRRLVRQEWIQRYGKPNAVVTVGNAVEAGAAINPMVAETD